MGTQTTSGLGALIMMLITVYAIGAYCGWAIFVTRGILEPWINADSYTSETKFIGVSVVGGVVVALVGIAVAAL